MVELPAGEVARLARPVPRYRGGGARVAATVDGVRAGVQRGRLVSHVEGHGGFARRLRVGGAGHSSAVDPILAPLRDELAGLDAADPAVPSYSTVSDDPRQPVGADDDYWVANVRRPVRFAQAVVAALADGHRDFVEVSPHPIAVASVEQTAAASTRPVCGCSRRCAGTRTACSTGSPARSRPGTRPGTGTRCGHGIPAGGRRPARPGVAAPHHWTAARPPSARGYAPVARRAGRSSRAGAVRLVRRAGHRAASVVARHIVSGLPLLPAAAFVELAMAAARDVLGGVALTGVRVVAPLVLGTTTEVCVSAHDQQWAGAFRVRTVGVASGVDTARHRDRVRVRGSVPGGSWIPSMHGSSRRLLDTIGAVLVSSRTRVRTGRATGNALLPSGLAGVAAWIAKQALRVVLLHDSPEWAACPCCPGFTCCRWAPPSRQRTSWSCSPYRLLWTKHATWCWVSRTSCVPAARRRGCGSRPPVRQRWFQVRRRSRAGGAAWVGAGARVRASRAARELAGHRHRRGAGGGGARRQPG